MALGRGWGQFPLLTGHTWGCCTVQSGEEFPPSPLPVSLSLASTGRDGESSGKELGALFLPRAPQIPPAAPSCSLPLLPLSLPAPSWYSLCSHFPARVPGISSRAPSGKTRRALRGLVWERRDLRCQERKPALGKAFPAETPAGSVSPSFGRRGSRVSGVDSKPFRLQARLPEIVLAPVPSTAVRAHTAEGGSAD